MENVGIIKLGLPLLIAGFVMTGCSSKKTELSSDDKVLLEVGDSALTINDVVRQIPVGLTGKDSVEMFNSITERWLRSMMLGDLAQENVGDLAKINRMAEDYRNSLIIDRYLRSKQDEASEVSEQAVKSYYSEHGEEMKLEAPIIKGIYLKVSDSEENIEEIRKRMKRGKPEDIDNIEKTSLRYASQYEYFGERWIDWNDIAELIPYRFYDADAFLKSTRDFETSYGGSVYLLHITEYKPSGEVMPFEFAKEKIREVLTREKKVDYRQQLLKLLYRKGIEEGKLKPGIYDPITGKISEIKDTETKQSDK